MASVDTTLATASKASSATAKIGSVTWRRGIGPEGSYWRSNSSITPQPTTIATNMISAQVYRWSPKMALP